MDIVNNFEIFDFKKSKIIEDRNYFKKGKLIYNIPDNDPSSYHGGVFL